MSGLCGISAPLRENMTSMTTIMKHRGEAEIFVDHAVVLAGLGKNALNQGSSVLLKDGNTQVRYDGTLECVRDHMGIKPLYYTVQNGALYFASEVKALLPFVTPEIDLEAFSEYLHFQYYFGGKTLFKGIYELPPAHKLTWKDGVLRVERYWQVKYDYDYDHTPQWFERRLRELLEDTIKWRCQADNLGAYVSGGLDSSSVACIAARQQHIDGYHGCFNETGYDESDYASLAAQMGNMQLWVKTITDQEFIDNIRKVIWHLDFPTMGPGLFPQFMVAQLVRGKTMLSGQGGDEVFGGYAKYVLAYFEQCFKAAIDGTLDDGNFIVTYPSILPNLVTLRQYKPLIRDYFAQGLFDDMDKRYYRLINRGNTLTDEIRWEYLNQYDPYEAFREVFYDGAIGHQSYFDLMTHYDFRASLPAMLQVEDRVNAAFDVDVKFPLLDCSIVEFAATVPSDIKFKDGETKHLLRQAMRGIVPDAIINRRDKMGFPVPLTEWANGPLREFIHDILGSQKALQRDLVDNKVVLGKLDKEPQYSRKLWGLFCLELWQQEFIDRRVS